VVKVSLDHLCRDHRPQSIRPKKFGVWSRILREPTGASQLSGNGPERIVIHLDNRVGNVVVGTPLAILVERVNPCSIIEINPERGLLEHIKLGQNDHKDLLDSLFKQGPSKMVVIDDIEFVFWPELDAATSSVRAFVVGSRLSC
jgi:hypothetical protein